MHCSVVQIQTVVCVISSECPITSLCLSAIHVASKNCRPCWLLGSQKIQKFTTTSGLPSITVVVAAHATVLPEFFKPDLFCDWCCFVLFSLIKPKRQLKCLKCLSVKNWYGHKSRFDTRVNSQKRAKMKFAWRLILTSWTALQVGLK